MYLHVLSMPYIRSINLLESSGPAPACTINDLPSQAEFLTCDGHATAFELLTNIFEKLGLGNCRRMLTD
jgi:hypothetical protein